MPEKLCFQAAVTKLIKWNKKVRNEFTWNEVYCESNTDCRTKSGPQRVISGTGDHNIVFLMLFSSWFCVGDFDFFCFLAWAWVNYWSKVICGYQTAIVTLVVWTTGCCERHATVFPNIMAHGVCIGSIFSLEPISNSFVFNNVRFDWNKSTVW